MILKFKNYLVNDYIKMYPVNVNVPYMLYISALSKYNLVKDEYRVINLIKDSSQRILITRFKLMYIKIFNLGVLGARGFAE